MNRLKFLLFIFTFSVARLALGQYNTATINNLIDTNEYGNGNVNMYPSGTAQWYITWDASYLYLSIQNANETEAAIVYVDVNPIVPVNGGTNAQGNLNGLPGYDNLTPKLPFRADAAIYANNNWRSVLIANGAGNWTVVSAGTSGLCGFGDDYTNGFYSSHDNFNGPGADDRRELKVAWSVLTSGGGIPASFNVNGYIAYTCGNTCGGMYAGMPGENPSGSYTIGSTPNLVRYFNIGTTANGTATPPFSRNCYTYIHGLTTSLTNFGFISVWDFTMNTPGDTIVRSNITGGDWYIGGSLIVNAGAVYFGPIGGVNYGESFVNNVRVYRLGRLDMDYTNKPLRVVGDVEMRDYNFATDSLVMELSQTPGGDLWLWGNMIDSTKSLGNGGKTYRGFGPRGRQVWFRGFTQQNIYAYSNDLTFDYVRIDNPQHVNLVGGAIHEYNQIDLINGNVILNNNDWIMETSNALINFTAPTSFFVTNGTGYLVQNQLGTGGKTGNVLFPIGNDNTTYRPAYVENTSIGLLDSVKARVMNGAYMAGTTGAPITTAFVNKTWLIQKATNANSILTLQYELADELPAFDRSFCSMMFQSGGFYTNTGPYGPNALGANPYTVMQSGITGSDTFSIASANPLPLEWLSFTVAKKKNTAILNWKVNDELNCLYYDVERSTDGMWYDVIGQQKAQTNTAAIASYTFYDNNFSQLNSNTVYYRIREWDVNGGYSHSPIRMLNKNENENYAALSGYTDGLPTVTIHLTQKQTILLNIIDNKGALIECRRHNLVSGDNVLQLKQTAAKGLYTLQIVSDILNASLRLSVQ